MLYLISYVTQRRIHNLFQTSFEEIGFWGGVNLPTTIEQIRLGFTANNEKVINILILSSPLSVLNLLCLVCGHLFDQRTHKKRFLALLYKIRIRGSQ